MESSKKYDNPSPEASANIFSKLFYCWLFPIFKFGYRNDLQLKHIYNTTKGDLSQPLGDALERNWDIEVKKANKKKKRPSLKNAIFFTFYKGYAIIGIILFFQFIILKMLHPVIIAGYIRFYNTPISHADIATGWLWGTGVVVMQFADIIITHYIGVACRRIALRVKVACSSLIYRKLLKLSPISLSQTTDGHLINLLSNDVARFEMASVYLHFLWITPLQAVVALYLMYIYVGTAGLAGMVAFILQAIPLQGFLSNLQGKFRINVALRTDHRIKLISEIISCIKVIKMYAWEKPFEKFGKLARRLELDEIRKTSIVKGIYMTITNLSRMVTLYIIIVTYVLLENRLTGYVVFSVVGLLATAHFCLSSMYPHARSGYAEVKVSIKRLEEILLLEETTDISITNRERINEKEKAGTVKVVKVNASWLPSPVVDTLMEINLEIASGTLCCVVGNVGSGKSSLLQLLLGELPANQGRIDIYGSIAYASQEPWLFVSSVRNNILFGRPFVKSRYKEVVRACALERDFKEFPYGDKTLVGEKGISLSGGQRARINLARAVYCDADVYLLDDPLSVVDTEVGKYLFHDCFKRFLKNKTRLLVTHQLQFLKEADIIVILSNGRIQNVCTYNELTESELLSLNQGIITEEEGEENTHEELVHRDRLHSISSYGSSGFSACDPQETDELIEKGAVSTSVYLDYFKAGGSIFFILFLIILFIAALTLTKAVDLWLTHWTNVEELTDSLSNINNTSNLTSISSTEGSDFVNSIEVSDSISHTILRHANTTAMNGPPGIIFVGSRTGYIIIYTILMASSVVSTLIRALLSYIMCIAASTTLHNKLFSNVLQAPMRFFYTNPSGRILNRFTVDVGVIDEFLPTFILNSVQVFEYVAGSLITVFIITPRMIVPAIVIGITFYYLTIVYLKTTQDVKRIEATLKAPVFSHISATMSGIATIRSSHAQNMVTEEFDILQNQQSSASVLYFVSNEAFGFYLEFVSAMLLLVVTYQFLIFGDDDTVSANVGLVISQSLTLSLIQYGIRLAAEIPNCMTNVERVLQYIKLDKEGPFESFPTSRPERDWPHSGKIIFFNVYVRYAPDEPPVLENLNVEIKPGEKVGIVGRTGAGKSTLVSSLFRLTPIEGKITLDGVDISTIGLHDLRSNISIIPQKPTLFSSSVKYNLDPFEKVSDEKLWQALDSVQLKGVVANLNMEVSEGGSNFSAGQKQLLCLARAIIRNNKILVMDETTANVDPQTDLLIQKTIRNHFQKCTVITVAHRLNTIMHSDRVLVMDAGQAVEFDHPHKLLQNLNGFFSKMVKQTGVMMETALRKVAQEDYEKKFISKNENNDYTETKKDA